MGGKTIKVIRAIAENLGLEVVEIGRSGTGHDLLRVKNSQGVICTRIMSGGSKMNNRDELNTKAELRRFARGQYHGLRVSHTRD